jgi:signal transduction histidine kinase
MAKSFFKRHMLLVGFFAVAVPLGALLAMQYKWLNSLAKTTALAEEAWLENSLEAVSGGVEVFYRTQAERALNPSAHLVQRGSADEAAHFFKKKQVEGAKYVFVAMYTERENWGRLLAYDPINEDVGPPTDQAIYGAISVALAPWNELALKKTPLQSHELSVAEMDPDNRVILNPISDEQCRIVGVAGMVVDNQYFEQTVLPAVIKKKLHKFFGDWADDFSVTVRDGKNRLVLGTEFDDGEAEYVTASMPFIFSNWKLALGSRYSPEQWARSNFMLNISMSIALAVVLIGGIVLALRTASREIKLSQMKSDFVSNVSHELRTPLASIRVFGEFLRLGRVKDRNKGREYGEYIETESTRLTQLINNILDFSKIESGVKTYQLESADIQEVVIEPLRTLEVSLRHRGFRILLEQPRGELPMMELDPDAIGQAVANLVDNAVKYSGNATAVQVRLERSGDDVVISVKDQGIGISKAEQAKIFERFHRVSTGLVHDVKGSGLGLSIVNHIVTAHQGKVSVESEPGQGSTFSIRLPIRMPDAPQAEDVRRPAVEPLRQMENP